MYVLCMIDLHDDMEYFIPSSRLHIVCLKLILEHIRQRGMKQVKRSFFRESDIKQMEDRENGNKNKVVNCLLSIIYRLAV